MPKVKVNDITMNYESQGSGEPLVLIPYLAADNACYAFQVADYAKHFTCISVDPRGAGETDKPAGAYSTECSPTTSPRSCRRSASSALMSAVCPSARRRACGSPASIRKGQIAVPAQRLAKTDPYLKDVVETWQVMARGLRASPTW